MMLLCLGIFVVSVYFLWFVLLKTKRAYNEPPGPTPWPIVGNLVQMALVSKNVSILKTFSELKKKYGEVISVQIGLTKTVMLTSHEAIQTIVNHEAVEKERKGMLEDYTLGQNIGIIMSDGKMWQENRSWTFRHLKEFGFKTSAAEHDMQDAATEIIQFIDGKIAEGNGKTNIDMDLFFSSRVFKLTWRMITGGLKLEDDKVIKLLCSKIEDLVRSGTLGLGLIQAFPVLRYLIPKLTGYDVQMSFFNTCNEVAKNLLLEARAKIEKEGVQGPPENLVEAFAQNMEKENGIFFMDNFKIIFQDLFLASTETISSYLESIILHLILFPEMQEKILAEIKTVALDEEFLNFDHKKKMIFTQAFLLEVHRCTSILPSWVPRKTVKDIEFKNYVIKKGTQILTDTVSIHNDPKVFGDPENFRPERFINEQGEIHGANRVLAFGVGKRACAGEINANLMSFIFLTAFVKKYVISVPAGHPKPSREMQPGFSCKPTQYEACYTNRLM